MLSKLNNNNGDNKDTTTRLITAYITLRHIYINIIVNYYNILQLKKLINIKIQYILGTGWSVNKFPNIVKDTFSLTGDLTLHNIIILMAAKHIKEFIKLKDFIKLDIISNFAICIIQTVITAFKDIEEIFT